MPTSKPFMLSMSPQSARALSLFVLGAIAIGYMGDAFMPDAPRAMGLALGALKLIGLAGAIALFLSSWGQQAMAGDDLIDERQQRERDRAFTLTHRVMVVSAIGAFFYVDLSAKLGLPLPERTRDAADLINVYILLSMALPGMILAWQAPTLPEDEE